jgi:hypothetical protein
MRRLMLPVLAFMLLAGGGKVKKLEDTEKSHYYALKVWMDQDQEKAFLKLKTQVR